MTIKLHIVRKAVIFVFPLIVLTAELTRNTSAATMARVFYMDKAISLSKVSRWMGALGPTEF